ncbi:MAG TPA: HEAT repeat domain-containing protein [Myxococcaceae bacterium]|nr:HEAT repeat domain-containing protein [Myxococcaceae bacterium]
MAGSSEQGEDMGAVPWWEATPVGTPVLLAFIALERVENPQSALLAGPEALRQRARYAAGVEYIATALEAAQPLRWQGDAVTLVFKQEGQEPASLRALGAAELLRERIVLDLAMRARLAVHVARVPWGPEALEPGFPAAALCERLRSVAPINGIAVTEDAYLALPEVGSPRLALLGRMTPDGVAAYVTPASLATQVEPGRFAPADDLKHWEAFRRYVNSPEIRRLRYVGFPLQKKQPPSLDLQEVFVAPEAHLHSRQDAFTPEAGRWLGGRSARRRSESEELGAPVEPAFPSEPLKSLVARHRAMVVLGDPGSGKTTVLRWMALLAAAGPLAWAEHLGPSERLLPLPVSVGRLAELRARQGGAVSVVEALALYFHDRNVGAVEALRGFLEQALEEGRCLVLLDGLDEVHTEARGSLLSWLETFCARFSRNRFVISARQVGYSGFELPMGVEVVLGPFSDEQAHRYIRAFERACRRWENNGLPDELGAERESERLITTLRSNPRLRELARNPFLLSALTLIHRAEGQLPRHRVQAYEVFARTLCETWSSARRVVASEGLGQDIRYEEEAIPILGELALRMHLAWPTGAAPEAFILENLAEILREREGTAPAEAERAARRFLERAGKDVQIILERGAGQWGFLHLTFQEFFTAVGLLSSERFEEVAFEHLLDPRWEEILRLGVGYMALIQKRAQATQRFIRRVLNHQEQGDREFLTGLLQKQVYLAALLASEAGDVLPVALQEEVARAVADWALRISARISLPLMRELALTAFNERVLDCLIPEMQSPVEVRRITAMGAIGALSGPRARKVVLDAVRDPDPEVRRIFCLLLVELGDEQAASVLSALARDKVPAVREAALHLLLKMPSPAQEFIQALLHEPDADVLASLMTVLRNMALNGRARGQSLSDKLDVHLLVQVLHQGSQHADEDVRNAAETAFMWGLESRALEKAGVKASEHRTSLQWREALMSPGSTAVIELLQSEVADLRALAIYTLAMNRDERIIPALVEFSHHPSAEVRETAVETLGRMGTESAQAALFRLVQDELPGVRAQALKALAHMRAPGVGELLLRGLMDPEPRVREGAIQGMKALEVPAAVPHLVQIARRSRLAGEKTAAVEALWQLAARGLVGPTSP